MCINPHLIFVLHRSFVNGEMQSRRLTVMVVVPAPSVAAVKAEGVHG
jgi:hypothetical protein